MNIQNLQGRPAHERSLELAAMAVDFELTRAETAELEAHLASCPACARRAAAMRADALALGRPLTLLPSSRVDAAVYAEIGRRQARPGRLVLIAAAALLLAALLGALAVGAYLLRDSPTLPTTVIPAPTPTPTASTETIATRPDPTPLPSGFPRPIDSQIIFNVGEGQTRRSIATGTIGGSAVREIALGQDPSFLPDREHMVFACTDSSNSPDVVGICLIRFDGSGLTRVVDDRTIRSPRWSPDASWLTYNRGMIDVGTAWIANKDGSSPRLLAAGSAPIWSADGLWLCYQPGGAAYQVAIIRPDGSGNRIVSGGYDPAWSPIAARLGFVRVDGSNASLVVATADAPVGTESIVFETRSPLYHPAWSSDDSIAFWMDGDLWRLDFGITDKPMRLTTGLGVSEGAVLSVSPDGEWLMFSSPELSDAQIYIVSIDGGWVPAGIELSPATRPIWRPVP